MYSISLINLNLPKAECILSTRNAAFIFAISKVGELFGLNYLGQYGSKGFPLFRLTIYCLKSMVNLALFDLSWVICIFPGISPT
jgi:hypothetical protein